MHRTRNQLFLDWSLYRLISYFQAWGLYVQSLSCGDNSRPTAFVWSNVCTIFLRRNLHLLCDCTDRLLWQALIQYTLLSSQNRLSWLRFYFRRNHNILPGACDHFRALQHIRFVPSSLVEQRLRCLNQISSPRILSPLGSLQSLL